MKTRQIGHGFTTGVLFGLAMLVMPAVAAAATLVVDADGTYDSGTNGCSGGDAAYTAIQSAVTASADLDTILVCPGTYAEAQIVIDKALTVQGVAGAASTIIDGTGGTGLAFAGTVVINATTGDVLFDGFTVQNAKAGPSSVRINVRVGSPALVTYTVTNNVLRGTNNPADTADYGLYAAGPTANDTLVFQYNTLEQHGANPILIERHLGPTDVSYNTWDRGIAAGANSGYVNMSHTGDAITTLQKVSYNTIDVANDPGPYTTGNVSYGIQFTGALTGSTLGTFSDVEISHNTITGLQAFRRAIIFWNNSPAPGTNGDIANVRVTCNTMTGVVPVVPGSGSQGIRFLGQASNMTIENNVFDGVDYGIRGQTWNGHVATGTAANENGFTNTGTAAVEWATSALEAEDNWWGSATGPTNPGNPGGTGGVVSGTGAVDFTPWLLSGGDADPGPCFDPGCSNGTTDPGESCDQGGANGDPTSCCTLGCTFRTAGETCRAGADLCDAAETCTGASGSCPADGAATAGTPCRPAAGACDVAETCDGTNTACPADSVSGAFVVCRPSAGNCDPAESCDGVGVDCPADSVSGAFVVCRPAAGACDLAENCDGVGATCPADAKSTAVCRAAAGVCDVAESCDGAGDACPADAFEPASTVCRPSAAGCDVAENCTGASAACPADTGVEDADTDTVCDGDDNCVAIANPAQENDDSDALGNACDPCTNIVPTGAEKTKLTVTKLLVPAGDEKVTFKGFFTSVPGTPTIDPLTNGLRFLITESTGATAVDVTIPGGAYDVGTKTGWRVNGAGTAWTFKTKDPLLANGIQKAQVKAIPSTPGKYKVGVKGKNGTYPVNPANLPLVGTIVIDVPYAETGQCGEAQFAAPPPAKPSCVATGGGNTVKCK